MMILCLTLIGMSLMVLSIALKNVNTMQKIANVERNYPKMMKYCRLANVIIIIMSAMATLAVVLMVNYSYNFYKP